MFVQTQDDNAEDEVLEVEQVQIQGQGSEKQLEPSLGCTDEYIMQQKIIKSLEKIN